MWRRRVRKWNKRRIKDEGKTKRDMRKKRIRRLKLTFCNTLEFINEEV
jgi:hypothetical protein